MQLSEHEPVQVTWQLEASHETLPLGPTVTVQLEPPLQSMLHDSAHEPVHVFEFAQSSEQLPSLQVELPRSQLAPEGQMQDEPVHDGARAPSSSLPHPSSHRHNAR